MFVANSMDFAQLAEVIKEEIWPNPLVRSSSLFLCTTYANNTDENSIFLMISLLVPSPGFQCDDLNMS